MARRSMLTNVGAAPRGRPPASNKARGDHMGSPLRSGV